MNELDVRWPMARDSPDVDAVLAELVNRPKWHQQAACRGVGPDLFFPRLGDGRPDAGLAYCERCSVQTECLATALEEPSAKGV